ncbi:MAG: hypothetical protein ACPHVL_07795 [Psychroflexus salarius]
MSFFQFIALIFTQLTMAFQTPPPPPSDNVQDVNVPIFDYDYMVLMLVLGALLGILVLRLKTNKKPL